MSEEEKFLAAIKTWNSETADVLKQQQLQAHIAQTAELNI